MEEQPNRLKLRSFVSDSMGSLFSVNSGFFYTLFKLAVKPWEVIRDYIQGRSDRYQSPVDMLVSILIYVALFTTYFDVQEHAFSLKINWTYDVPEGAEDTAWTKCCTLFHDIVSSQEFTYILLCFPIVWAVYLTYYKFGAKRFNTAEYLVAALYMLCMLLIYDSLHMLVSFFGVDTCYLDLIIPACLSVLSLLKAFHVRNRWVRILLLLACILMIALFCIVFESAIIWLFSLL